MQIQLENVGYRYASGESQRDALDGISLTLHSGECVGLIGPSGSGKSTLAQLLNGLLRPVIGRLLCDGKPLDYGSRSLHNLRRHVGLIMQMPEAQIFEATVFHEVAYAARQRGLPEVELPDRVNRALAWVGLEMDVFGQRDPMRLSGGEARLVTIASLLVVDPDWLILDEPTLGLDFSHTKQIRLLAARRRQLGRGTLLISHDLDLIFDLCSRVIVLRDGRLAFDGEAGALFQHHDLKDEFGLESPARWEIQRRLAQGLATWSPDGAALEAGLEALSPVERAPAEEILRQYLREHTQSEAAK